MEAGWQRESDAGDRSPSRGDHRSAISPGLGFMPSPATLVQQGPSRRVTLPAVCAIQSRLSLGAGLLSFFH